jgi:hypothetical protein
MLPRLVPLAAVDFTGQHQPAPGHRGRLRAPVPPGDVTGAADKPLLIGVSARIYYPGSQGPLPGVFTKTLHYLEQSVAHWVLSGHAMAVMIPAVTKDSIVLRSDLELHDYAQALDGLVLQGGNDVAPESYGETPLQPRMGRRPGARRLRDRADQRLHRRRQAGVRRVPRLPAAQRDARRHAVAGHRHAAPGLGAP